VNEHVRDRKDGLPGIVGCEMNFKREFYVHRSSRSAADIREEIEVMEKGFMEMLGRAVR